LAIDLSEESDKINKEIYLKFEFEDSQGPGLMSLIKNYVNRPVKISGKT